MKFILLVVVCCISAAFCGVIMEDAPVTDAKLIEQGYTCQSDSAGPMKDNESIDTFKSETCARAICSKGRIMHMTCPTTGVAENCKLQSNFSKPYPECCPHQFC